MGWPDLEDGLSDAVDAAFGEAMILYPMTAPPNVPVSADAGREVTPFTAIFDDRRKAVSVMPGSQSLKGGPGLSTPSPRCWCDVRQFDVEPRRLDQIKRVATGDVYQIADVRPDGQGRIECDLKHLRQTI